MAIETVFILGAGASKAEGAPLQKELFTEYHCGLHQPESTRDKTDAEILKFFRAFFGIDFAASEITRPLPTFEDVLGIVEIALQRGESFPDFDLVPRNSRLQGMREHLVNLIANMLGNIGSWGPAAHHQKLVNSLHKQGSLLRTCFISLNYDTFIDGALDLPDVDLDYGVEFAKLRAKGWKSEFLTERRWRKPRPARSVALYKVHGSLNWLYCSRCTALIIVPKRFPWVAPIEGIACPCGSYTVSPIIIPPTFFKLMSNFHLQQIWRHAERALMSARRIVFCGYSLPDADLHIKYLLKRAELNRQGAPPEVYIVNGRDEECRKRQREDERERYLRLWRDPSLLHFKNLSFEDLCQLWPDAFFDAPEI